MPRSVRACPSACSSMWALAAASSTTLAGLGPRASCSRRNCCARWRRSAGFERIEGVVSRDLRARCVKSPWRAYLDLYFRVTEKRGSNKVLDTLKKEYRGTSTAYRGQHKAQRGMGVLVGVDIENFMRSAEAFD